ncbi:hypothetical protein [Acinetobacter sp. A47]|uniref:hypothetical protein n=1 Tax=Acinetobacter sp. A47 TaxID=1561217 RepID=UPI00056DE88F|nr:hypothetical protein [Acinetobacter sp. A47]
MNFISEYKFELNANSNFQIDMMCDSIDFFKVILEFNWYHESNNKIYMLESSFFENVGRVDHAYAIAKELIDLLNGYAQFTSHYNIIRPVVIKKCYINDSVRNIDFKTIRPQNYILQVLGNGNDIKVEKSLLKKSLFHTLTHIAKHNTTVYCLMKFCSLPISWSSLHKIFETLKSAYVSDYAACPWSEEDAWELLVKPSNKYDILGLDAQQGYDGEYIGISFDESNNSVALMKARNWLMPLVNKYMTDISQKFFEEQ